VRKRIILDFIARVYKLTLILIPNPNDKAQESHEEFKRRVKDLLEKAKGQYCFFLSFFCPEREKRRRRRRRKKTKKTHVLFIHDY